MNNDPIPRATMLLTELLRRIAVPPPHLSYEGAGRVAQLHGIVCRKLEPQLRNAVVAIEEMERLEADRAMLLSKGDNRRADEVTQLIQRLMDSTEQDLGSRNKTPISRTVQHGNGFCSAVSTTASPRKRCLPTTSRTKTPERSGLSTPNKVVMTRTGLASTPPTSTTRRVESEVRSRGRGRLARSPSARGQSPRGGSSMVGSPVVGGLPEYGRSVVSISPTRPQTPLAGLRSERSGSVGVTSPYEREREGESGAASPRRDREFITALLRSLQLQEYAPLFADMSLLSFYRMSVEQLAMMGLPPQAQKTLHTSIDQIKQIADNHSTKSPWNETSLS